MKKLLTIMLSVLMLVSLAACTSKPEPTPEPDPTDVVTVMSHEEFVAAELDSEVTVETYVQDHQSWWDNKVTVYCQSEDGAYFLYELACSEEDAAKLTEGTKIRVSGVKSEWAGEVEITDGTFEFVEAAPYVAEFEDVTALAGSEELVDHLNEKVSFKGVEVVSVEHKNGDPAAEGFKYDDIYVTGKVGDAEVSFCVEYYLRGTDTEVYQTVCGLEAGEVVDIDCFLYWYNGANPHVVAVSK